MPIVDVDSDELLLSFLNATEMEIAFFTLEDFIMSQVSVLKMRRRIAGHNDNYEWLSELAIFVFIAKLRYLGSL